MEIKDVIGYLQVIDNPKDDVNLRRIVNVPKRGIGDTTVDQLQSYADEHGLDLFTVMETLEENDDLKIRAQKNIKQFVNLMHLLMNKKEELSLSELVEAVLFESHYVEELKKKIRLCRKPDLKTWKNLYPRRRNFSGVIPI